jgi:putative ATP-binding cassette transporter
MKLLGLLVAAFAVIAVIAGAYTHHSGLYLLAGFSLGAAITTYRSVALGAYLEIFVAIFSIETILFGGLCVVDALGLWPDSLDAVRMQISVADTVALFSILVYASSFIPIVHRTMTIADRYFSIAETTRARIWPFPSYCAPERFVAIGMVVFLVVINQFEVFLSILLSFGQRDFFNALQEYNQGAFWFALFVEYSAVAMVYVAALVVEYVVSSTLTIRWRQWLTGYYAERWLTNHAHYRMNLIGGQADNPDQRISEDIVRFINPDTGELGVYTLSITLISTLSSLVSFSILLWALSRTFTFPGTSIVVPGFLFWCSLLYATIGTGLVHWIGWPLAALSFTRQRFEADFRFALARLREYNEQVALLRGEATENLTLRKRFAAIVHNYFEIIALRKRMTAFQRTFDQVSVIIPYVVAAPFYFAKKITLGVLSQTARAFAEVNGSLTIFVNYYSNLAEFKAVLDRLTSFEESLARVEAQPQTPSRRRVAEQTFDLYDMVVRLPDGRPILSDVNIKLGQNESVLVKGPSGSGKSTLFRAIAGIWPYASGTISIPENASLMVLPQKPYLPIGTLRDAVAYPSEADTYDRAAIEDVLRDVKLEGLIEKLDVEDNWTQRLSGGEQQRVAIARAILAKPDWLLLDEATAAMDIALERAVYETIARRLPFTTIVSNAHRETLDDHHDRHLAMHEIGDGRFAVKESRLVAAQ